MSVSELNSLPPAEARDTFLRCCSSQNWATQMTVARPFADLTSVFERAEKLWNETGREDWLEAFRGHPRIGEKALKEKFGAGSVWAEQEQKGTQSASPETLEALLEGNQRYEAKFGHVFLICATGKSASEMLAALQIRLDHQPEEELRIAAGEQAKITRLRLEKLLKP